MHHVLIRDEADPLLYRRITEEDRPRLVPDMDLYRVVEDPSQVCLVVGEERLCSFDQPHEHQ